METHAGRKEKGDRIWFRVMLFVLPKLATVYFKLLELTCRKVIINRECEDEVCTRRPFVMAGFHGSLLYHAYYGRKFGGAIMVSRSFDGDLMDKCLRSWGYWTVRGSSSRGGKEALSEIIELARERRCATGMAVDAPRGPAGKAKVGVVILAREAEQPVVPVGCWTTRHVQFSSWDKMILPLPFGTIVMAYGKPIEVPKRLAHHDYDALRLEVEQSIAAAQALAEAKVRELKNEAAGVPVGEISPYTPPHSS